MQLCSHTPWQKPVDGGDLVVSDSRQRIVEVRERIDVVEGACANQGVLSSSTFAAAVSARKLELDNLSVVRALRGVDIGRRSYRFAGADSGGKRAAGIYSLICTAKLNGVKPGAYLHYVLARVADMRLTD
jgi:hypothetical protein